MNDGNDLYNLGENVREQLNDIETSQTCPFRQRLIAKQIWWGCAPPLFALTDAIHTQLWMEHDGN